ncbi:hypothetical protein D3C86_1708640 [compost metagenome]
MQRIAPGTAVIAAAGAHENGRQANQRPLALNGRAEDFADADRRFLRQNLLRSRRHGRYSAQVLAVSLTRTALVSGRLILHQS